MKRALICGVSGQDGGYLAKLLLDKGYEVFGTSRDAELSSFSNLETLGITGQVKCVSMSLTDFRSVLQVLSDVEPDEIYNLAGQSSVGLSFQQPVETLESIAFSTLNLLEVLRFRKKPVRFYNAASGECYGETSQDDPATETSAFHPKSPYGVAKCAAYWAVANYRESYGLYACSGMLFNHESPLRPDRFVTRKIVQAACRIASGSDERLKLGNLDVIRDWGFAPEYVDAMWRMLQQDTPEDYIIATGQSHSLMHFLECVFEKLGLDWRKHTQIDKGLLRASDIAANYANPSKAKKKLGWAATTNFDQLVEKLIAAEKKNAV
ncbi:MAG: GDP-mannose 4,6-dehydratase [Robiginitomaculum sp.]|nr:GDP-mannose 4,6-dehydratase [Robiginitomaculum sp.]